MIKSFFCALVATVFFSANAVYAADVLEPGQQLTTGQPLYSSNNAYYAILQTDGNFVIYKAGGAAVWATSTTGTGAVRAVMQTDGNFVLYNSAGTAVWYTNTSGNPNSYLAVDGDWGGIRIESVGPAWASDTSDGLNPPNDAPIIFAQNQTLPMGQDYYQASGLFDFRFQTDGNLVLYKNGKAIWTSNTSGKGATKAVVQAGMLQLLNTQGGQVWSTYDRDKTYDPVGGYFAFQADGNLVFYGTRQVWAGGPHNGASNAGRCYGSTESCIGTTIPIYKITY